MKLLAVLPPLIILAVAAAFVLAPVGSPSVAYAAQRQCGVTSWYGTESGHRTASGTRFTGQQMTAAHRTLPFGTKLLVTDMDTGRRVKVVVDDRGPAAWTHRFLDLSHRAALALGIVRRGTARVCIERIT